MLSGKFLVTTAVLNTLHCGSLSVLEMPCFIFSSLYSMRRQSVYMLERVITVFWLGYI